MSDEDVIYLVIVHGVGGHRDKFYCTTRERAKKRAESELAVMDGGIGVWKIWLDTEEPNDMKQIGYRTFRGWSNQSEMSADE